MEKTIRQFLVVMIVSGTLFSYGCLFTDDLYDADNEIVIVESEDGEEEVEGGDDLEVEVGDNEEEGVLPGVEEIEIGGEAAPAPVEPVVEPVAEVVEPVVEPVIEPDPVPEPTTMYQDGSFTQTGNYMSPEGPETIGVTFTIDNDVVTAMELAIHASDSTSKQHQILVKDAAPSLVVGKNLDEIGAFSKINHASLTTKGFNKAVSAIKVAAKN